MAQKQFNLQSNYGWGLSLDMTGKAPEVAKRIFDTYEDAYAYANDMDDSAVEGLILTVVNDPSKNGAYFVKSARKAAAIKLLEGEDKKILSGTTYVVDSGSSKADAEAWANTFTSYTDETGKLNCFKYSADNDYNGRGKIFKAGNDYYELRQIKCDTTELVKLSTAADSIVSADAVKDMLTSYSSVTNTTLEKMRTDVNAVSGVAESNKTDIATVNTKVETVSGQVTNLLDVVIPELQDDIEDNANAISAITTNYKIKDVNEGDKVLAVNADGKLSSTLSLDYVSSAQTIYLKGINGETISSIDATDFIKDGMLSGVTLEKQEGKNTQMVFTFNADGGTQTISLDVEEFLNADEVDALERSLEQHKGDTTLHFTTEEKTKLTNLYSKDDLDGKFNTINSALTANTQAHSDLSGEIANAKTDIATVNTKVETVSGNVIANAERIEEVNSALTAHQATYVEKIGEIEDAISGLTDANDAAHQTLQQNINSANTKINAVETAYKAADQTIINTITELDAKVKENEEVTATALTDLKANTVTTLTTDEVSNIVIEESKDENGISYKIGFQWLNF